MRHEILHCVVIPVRRIVPQVCDVARVQARKPLHLGDQQWGGSEESDARNDPKQSVIGGTRSRNQP